MPSRNTLKIDIPQTFFHVYARGVNKQPIFYSAHDYLYFIHLMRRYLSPEVIRDKAGTPYQKLNNDIEAMCYCLMPNHFHLLLYQVRTGAMVRLMRGVMTAYSMYINRTQQRCGPLFESRYKASMIDSDAYLQHVSRYIHLNPRDWREYPYSSLQNYLTDKRLSDWLTTNRIASLFASAQEYLAFHEQYEAKKEELDEIKHQLADSY